MAYEFLVFAARVIACTLHKPLAGFDAYADHRHLFYTHYIFTHQPTIVWC